MWICGDAYDWWKFENATPNDEWKRMVEELEKYLLAVMWRPEGGKYVKGETVFRGKGHQGKSESLMVYSRYVK